MNYKLDSISLNAFGAIPSPGNDHFALTGMFDLPKRIGTTEYNWGTSIEPFVQAEDIELDGRTLILNVAIKKSQLQAFKVACVECRELSTGYEAYEVVQKDEITVTKVGEYCKVIVPFWQEVYNLEPMPMNPSGSGTFRMDAFDLRKDFGVYLSGSDNLLNTAKRIDVPTTEFYERTNYRSSRNISLQCAMIGDNSAMVFDNMRRFHALMMAPGTRSLQIRNNTFPVYFKDGMTVTAVKENVLQFTLTATSV